MFPNWDLIALKKEVFDFIPYFLLQSSLISFSSLEQVRIQYILRGNWTVPTDGGPEVLLVPLVLVGKYGSYPSVASSFQVLRESFQSS